MYSFSDSEFSFRKKEVAYLETKQNIIDNRNNFEVFMTDVDSWVKKINSDLSDVQVKMLDLPTVLEEFEGNINHNYELIHDVKKCIDDLKEEIRELKMMQLISLKSRALSEIKH